MTAYVLARGTAAGAGAARLREAGHEVHAPTPTGLGERAHLAGPEIGLRTHTDDLLGLLR